MNRLPAKRSNKYEIHTQTPLFYQTLPAANPAQPGFVSHPDRAFSACAAHYSAGDRRRYR